MQSLLDERDPQTITVTDVVAEAGVSRPTFYAVFGTLPNAFAESALQRLSEAFSGLSVGTDVPESRRAEDMSAAFARIITRLEAHRMFYVRTTRGPGGHEILAAAIAFVAERLRHHSPLSPALRRGPLPLEATTTALAAGVTWLTLDWLDEPGGRSVRDLADLVRAIVLRAVDGGLAGDPDDHDSHKEHR